MLNLKKLYTTILTNTKDTILFLQRYGILKETLRCSKNLSRNNMTLIFAKKSFFRCNKCKSKKGLYYDTVLASMRIKLKHFVLLTYCFACEIDSYFILRREIKKNISSKSLSS